MGALLKRIGLAVVVFDLLVGVASASVLHHSGAAGKMSAGRLEQVVLKASGAVRTTCTSDPTTGWDYYCVSSDGSRALYDVSADRIVQRADLPSGA